MSLAECRGAAQRLLRSPSRPSRFAARIAVEELPQLRHAPTQPLRIAAVTLGLLALTGGAARAQSPTPAPNIVWSCAAKINTGLRNYTTDALAALTDCALTHLRGDTCTADNLASAVDQAAGGVSSSIKGPTPTGSGNCTDEALFDLCPLDADTKDPTQLRDKVVAPLLSGGAVESKLAALVDDLYVTSFAGCARPSTAVANNTDLYQCAQKIADVTGQVSDPLESCFFSCERARIQTPSNDICVDDITGDPIASSPTQCKATELAALGDVGDRCSDDQVVALGCPLGAHDVAALIADLGVRLAAFAEELNLDVYHSDCQGNLPGQPTDPVPANVTLSPSLTHKQITCGQTLDGGFFGTDTAVHFDSDLDCSPAKTATDGVIVAKSKVVLDGRSKTWSITGPSHSSLRTGAGIRLAPGVARVQIKGFKAIQNFGVGILDADEANDRRLVVAKTTVRRNRDAGLRLRSPRAKIDTVTADKNGIGMDLSGDGTKVKASDIKGSLYDPMIGLRLSGIDKNGDGRIVQLVDPLNTIELNLGVGVLIAEGAHTLSNAQVRSNVGAGIEICGPSATASGCSASATFGVGSVLHDNSVKLNGDGIVVDGDSNLIEYNVCEQNLGTGFVIGGNGNTVSNNQSGNKTDLGNGQDGYRITGQGALIQDNSAEANVGSGFVVTPTGTATFKSDTSDTNFEHGFDIQSPGNTFDTCAAEKNDQAFPKEKAPSRTFHEWNFVAGNGSANKTNSASGDSINIPAVQGFCDSSKDCPTK
jgi:hypothetical protein